MNDNLEDVVKVLFVDDEPNILSSLQRGLIEEPFIKYFATSGEEALSFLKENEIYVIVTDMRMPGMNGFELLKKVTSEYPNVIKIVLSGYNQLPQILATINTVDVFKYIPKPWDMDNEFIPILKSAIEQYKMVKTYKRFNAMLEKKNDVYQKMILTSDEKIAFLKNRILEEKAFYHMVANSTEILVKKIMLLQHNDEVKLSLISWLYAFNSLCVESYGADSTWAEVNKHIDEAEKMVTLLNTELGTQIKLLKSIEVLSGVQAKVLLPINLLKQYFMRFSKDLILTDIILQEKLTITEISVNVDSKKTCFLIAMNKISIKMTNDIVEHWRICLQKVFKVYQCDLLFYEKDNHNVFLLIANHMEGSS